MLSQSPGIYIILAAVVSGTLLIINNLLVTSIINNFQLEREKQQGIRQQESERQKWYREKIYDSYKTSFQVLVKIQQEELDSVNKLNDIFTKNTHISNINKLILEFNIEFTMIIANHPDKNSEEFIDKLTKIDKSLRAATIDKSLEEDSSKVRLIMIEIMENDSRIKI